MINKGYEKKKMSLERNETGLIFRKCTGSTNTSHLLVFKTEDLLYNICIISY